MKAQHTCTCNSGRFGQSCQALLSFAILILFFSTAFSVAQAAPLSITVNATDGTPVPNFRWLVEEDQTYNIIPGDTCFNGNTTDCQAVNFHKSYMPVVAEGHSSDTMPNLDSTKRYYISVLPDTAGTPSIGHTIGGTKLGIGETNAVITVAPSDVPTAQIRVFVFNDNAPINGAPDTPQETGIAGMKIIVEDAGGRYGMSAQHIVNDVYGNPLGTTYLSQDVVDVMGDGTITTDANGFVTIKNLAPAKYGIQAVPETGSGLVQTSTIEGKHVIDAWVKADEPPFFIEFGPPGPHVFIGFTQQFSDTALTGGATITGSITSLHNSRPPEFTFHSGAPVGGCWVGLNESNGGLAGKGLFAAPCDGSSDFSIPNVPVGNYQLVVWDEPLDYIIAAQAISVTSTANVDLGNVPIFSWFSRIEQKVFHDANENGIWDAGEVAMPEQGTAIRWRDGTMYQSFPTDLGGEAPYDEVFPFFSWLVAEVAFDRFKATGVTVRVDGGGALGVGEVLNPQAQSENAGAPFRVETGPVLTQAFQVFAGQTNILEWGKTPYAAGENGGISGIVYYATTRAEDDPRYAGAEVWEPGVPRIQVALYQDLNADGVIDDINSDVGIQIADVDNAPFGNFPGPEDFDYNFTDNVDNAPLGNFPGPEDYNYSSNTAAFDAGDAIQVGSTDSWDDNVPTNCEGDVFLVDGVTPTDCFDGLRNFNQVRPGVFDGGYAFDSYFPGGASSGSTELDGLPSGTYIVTTGDHKTYQTLKEEDRNVDFGDNFVIPQQLPPICVGEGHLVPPVYSLFDSVEPPFYANQTRPLCDRKQVLLTGGKNAAADFFIFTQVPTSAHIVGTALNDLANEFDANAPSFGEKFAPANIPISIRDWQGNEVSRTYSDRWGQFNALVPSTYTNSLPSSSGMSPNMLTACMNDPGPIDIGGGIMATDPQFKREYSQFCYTLQYLPGVTTYLDTPVLPISAFTGPGQFPLDCEYPDGTPVIWSSSGPSNTGPFVLNAGDTLTLVSAGDVDVRNPDFNGSGTSETITRDFGFGTTAGTVTIDGTIVPTATWDNDTITLAAPAGGGQLEIQRNNGLATRTGIHVTVGGTALPVAPGGSIQAAIDLAPVGSTVLIPPGNFNEVVVMWKPIRLQGSGASTVINASSSSANLVQGWRTTVGALVTNGDVDLLPAQGATFSPGTLLTEQGAGIIVLAKDNAIDGFLGKETRIDGITINGSNLGGGIVVNGYAHGLEISNNRLFNNFGIYGGGIRVGHSIYSDDSINTSLNIHNNYVAENGGNFGAGGGISLNWGSDNYSVANNYVCGNFTTGNGGGIGHLGKSPNGQMTGNTVLFNQSFNQGISVAGGGIFVGGSFAAGGALTEGSGSVVIDANLIQGNNAGAGNGGGISLARINGLDAAMPNDDPTLWYSVDITNNKIVNNVAGLAGGGISLLDAVKVNISNNTIAHNDTTATTGEAFCDTTTGLVCDPNQSTPRAAGIVSYQHSATLNSLLSTTAAGTQNDVFSNPDIVNNIIWENRSFYFLISNATTFGLIPDISGGDPAVFDDLAVYPPSATNILNPMSSTLTDITGYDASNMSTDPNFVFDYFNGGDGTTVNQAELTTGISVQPAFDEGGNFIEVRYGPLSPLGDYKLLPPPPIAAILIAPSGNIGANSTPTYTWNAVANDTDYLLWVVDVATGTPLPAQWYTAATAGCDAGQATCAITAPAPLAPAQYRWTILTRNVAGNGPWSTPLLFLTGLGAPPSATTLIAPEGNIGVNDTPTYTWNAVANDTNYLLWVVDVATGTPLPAQWYTAATAGCDAGQATCAITAPAPLAPAQYRWTILTRNMAGNGPWSTPVLFSTGLGPPPPATTLISPSGSIGANSTPTYTWNAVANDTDYLLWVVDVATGTPLPAQWYTAATAGCGVGQATCAITAPVPLAAPGQYRWMILTRNAAGNGQWSSVVLFDVTL